MVKVVQGNEQVQMGQRRVEKQQNELNQNHAYNKTIVPHIN